MMIFRMSKRKVVFFTLFSIMVLHANANNTFIDSIEYYDSHAEFSKALSIVNRYKQQQISKEIRLELLFCEATVYLNLGIASETQEILNQADKIITSLKSADGNNKFRFLILKARYLNLCGKFEEALNSLKKAENIVTSCHNCTFDNVSDLFGELADYYYLIEDYHQSKIYFDRALKNCTKNNQEMILYYNARMAHMYWLLDDRGRSAITFNKCLMLLDIIKNETSPTVIKSYFLLVYYYLEYENDVKKAEALLLNTLVKLTTHYPKDHYFYGIFSFVKARVLYARNEFESAYLYCRNFENFAAKCPVLYQYRKENFSMMSSILFYKKDYMKAIFYSTQASKLYYSSQTNNFLNYLIALSYSKLNNKKLANIYYNNIIANAANYKSLSDIKICGYAYYNLGNKAYFENNLEKALNYLTQASIFFNKNPIPTYLESRTYLFFASIYFYHKADAQKGMDYVQLAIIAGCKSFSDKNYAKNPAFEDIVFNYSLIEAFNLKAYILYSYYEITNELNYLEEALECQEISVKLYERTILNINEENSGLNLADLKVLAMNNAVSYATLLYLKTKDHSYAEKAFEYAEKSKMQLLLIKTLENNSKYSGGVPDSLITKEENLDHKIIEIENLMALHEKLRPDLILQEKQLQTLTVLYNQRDELVNTMERNYPAYYQAKYNFKVSGIKEIQKILKQDQVILEYQLLNTEMIIFIITSNSFDIYYQLIDQNFPLEIMKLRKAISIDPSQENSSDLFSSFVGSSQYLYSKLIQPVYHLIKNKRLIIIPHNDLTQIPFEVLISESPSEDQHVNYRKLNYLINEFPIIYAYSANLLLDEGRQKKKYGRGTALFLPEYSGNVTNTFPQLKGAASEAKSIKKLSHGKIFESTKAREESFKSEAGRFRVLHIASHTVLDSLNPFLSSMVLTAQDSVDDGHLYAYEISQLELKAQLVVLSGCNTGYGILRRSEGLISIARSFFYTGVRTIAYTLWPVADKAGFALCELFYRGVKKDQQMDVAMRNAKLEYLKNADPVKTHPYYWANYIIVGNTDNVPLKKYPLLPTLLIGFPIFLVLLYFIGIRKRIRL